ncbi:MAG: Flp pilus assembly protein CpaB [Faecalibacterium sp.]|nr:Flp pilus assembly protein CpaB [Ruminococcus sp.]MCM1391223.1 Flp pilus assembly protein CpaB [Ruminococcus sp.]MCM1486633.1 Flp pilus assembly protein CpaB [Faecalibacterium sp.]
MKNRTVIGIICIILAVAITFGISPMVNKMTEGKTEVITFSKNLGKGTQITEADIVVTSLLKSGLPEKAITNTKEIIGKYTNSDVYKGDVATSAKLADDANASDNILSALNGDKVAMSITIKSFAGGLSGKIQNGDIVSIYVAEKDEETTVPPELKYIKVITTTTSGGVDENEVVPNEDGTFDLPTTITVLVTVKQAQLLADYEKNADMHVALVYRGNDDTAGKFIKTQDKYLKEQAKKAQEEKKDA